MFLILQNYRFRLFWVSNLFNDAGRMVTPMAVGWLVLILTDSPLWVGISAGASGLGLTLFSPIAGVLVDRYGRRDLLLATLVAEMACALLMGFLVHTDNISVVHVLLFAFIMGIIGATRYSCVSALTLDLVGRSNLLKGVAANFFSMTVMGVVAPVALGWIIRSQGVPYAYYFIAGTSLVSLVVLMNLRGITAPEKELSSHVEDLIEGAKFVFNTPIVRMLILAMLVSETFGWAVESMLPVIARDELSLGPEGLGYLMSAGAFGAVIPSIMISVVPDIKSKGILMFMGLVCFGSGLVLFALSKQLYISLVFIAFTMGSGTVYESALSTLLQTSVPNNIRGRVLSFQTFCWGFSGMAGFHAGAVAALFGAPLAVAAGGVIVLLNGLRIGKKLIVLTMDSQRNVSSRLDS
jgi:MFS family permease